MIFGFLMLSMIKLILNPYPTLHDLNIAIFFFLMNITLIMHYVESLYPLLCIVGYSIVNSLFLWITWLERFSGNANFFYFQTIAFNASLVFLFLQLMYSADSKRKKYANELCKINW